MHNITNLFYFGTTIYVFRTVFPPIIRNLKLYIQHQVYVIPVLWLLATKQPQNRYDKNPMLYVQSQTPDDGQKDRLKHVVLSQNKINEILCIWLVLLQKYITMHGPTNVKNKTHVDISQWLPTFVFTRSFTFRQYQRCGNVPLYFLNLDRELRIIQTFTMGSPSFRDMTQPRLAKMHHIPEGWTFLAPMRNPTTSQSLHC